MHPSHSCFLTTWSFLDSLLPKEGNVSEHDIEGYFLTLIFLVSYSQKNKIYSHKEQTSP